MSRLNDPRTPQQQGHVDGTWGGEDLVVIQRTLGDATLSITADLDIGRVPNTVLRAANRYGDPLDPDRSGSTEGPFRAPTANDATNRANKSPSALLSQGADGWGRGDLNPYALSGT